MASLISHTIQGSTDGSNVTTTGINTTGANIIFLCTAQDNQTTPTDSNGNTWTLAEGFQQFNVYANIYYCYNPTVGSGHTFSLSTSSDKPSIAVLAFSGSASSPLDQVNGASGGFSSTVQPGSVTPTTDNQIIITCVENNGGSGTGPYTINSGFTVSDWCDNNSFSGQNHGLGAAYLIQTTAAAVNPTWSGGSGNFIPCVIATFKTSSVVSTTVSPLSILGAG